MKLLRLFAIIIVSISIGLLVSKSSPKVTAWQCGDIYSDQDQPPDECRYSWPQYKTNPCRADCGQYDDSDYTATSHPPCDYDNYGNPKCWWNYNYHGCCTICQPGDCNTTPVPTSPPGTPNPTNPPNTPIPTVSPCPGGNPTCTSFTNFYLNNCTPASNYTSVPRSPLCETYSRFVTEYRSPGGGPDYIQTQELADPNVYCVDVTSGWSAPMPLTSSESRTLSSGAGPKKVCAKYTCSTSGASVQCGGMIDLKKTCSITPNNTTTTIPYNTQTSYTLSGTGQESSPEPVNIYLARPDHAQIVPAPAGTVEVVCTSCTPQMYFYRFAQTTSANSIPSTITAQTPLVNPGTYLIHCDLPTSPGACSGNPICTYEGGTYTCTGWQSCSSADNSTLIVSAPTPTPTAAARARARTLNAVPQVCGDITGNSNYRATNFTMTGESNRSSDASGNYAAWVPLSSVGSKTLGIEIYTDYTPYFCRYIDGVLDANLYSGQSQTYAFAAGNYVRWEIGYAPPAEWIETRGGDVYGFGGITSLLPQSLTRRYFSLNGHQNYGTNDDPGLVIHGGSVDFTTEAGDGAGAAPNQVSAKGWVAADTYATNQDFFQHLYLRLGAPTTPNLPSPAGAMTEPASSGIYYTNQAVTTGANWDIESGKSVIVIINNGSGVNSLTISHTIDVANGGFLAFIVSGNIRVEQGVGHIPPTNQVGAPPLTDDVDGIYVANGTFTVEGTGSGSDLQFVGNGSFIANNFVFNRDFRPANAAYAVTNPVELFVYNPRLLFTMPLIMQEIPVRWEETAPSQ